MLVWRSLWRSFKFNIFHLLIQIYFDIFWVLLLMFTHKAKFFSEFIEIYLGLFKYVIGDSLVAQMVKCLPTIWETWVQSLSWEDPLEKEMATHSNIFAWKIPWTKEPGGLQSMGTQRVRHVMPVLQFRLNYAPWLLCNSIYLFSEQRR